MSFQKIIYFQSRQAQRLTAFRIIKSMIFPISSLPQSQPQLQRSRRPSGCCPCRHSPSWLHAPVRRMSLQTARQNAFIPSCRSCRRMQDLPPCYPDAKFFLCRHRWQRRNISFPARCIPSYRFLQPGAGNGSGSSNFL